MDVASWPAGERHKAADHAAGCQLRLPEFQGYQFLGDGRDVQAPGAWGMAILRQAHVSAAGTRPPEQPSPSNV